MTDFTPTFLKKLKGITLSDNERLQMRERLAAYADMHPMPAPAVRTTVGFFSVFTARHFSVLAVAFLLIIGTGSGITLAADQSVPGDALYSLKIHVNEPLMSAFAPTETGQAKAAATIATRRVDEAVTLASRGELTPDKQAYLTQAFSESVKTAAKKTDALASTGNTEGANTVKANLAADLANEAQALGAVSTTDTKARAELLRAVVATTEGFADTSEGGSAVLAVQHASETATDTDIEPTTAVPALQSGRIHAAATLMKAAVTVAATSTPAVPVVPVTPTVRHLHLTPTELRAFASSTVRSRLLAPKTDFAIPTHPALPATPSEDLQLGD